MFWWKWWCHWYKILPGKHRWFIAPVSADKMASQFAGFRNDTRRRGISVFPCRTWCWIWNVISSGWLVETRQKFSLKWVHDFYWLKAFVQNFERKFRGHNGKFSLPSTLGAQGRGPECPCDSRSLPMTSTMLTNNNNCWTRSIFSAN